MTTQKKTVKKKESSFFYEKDFYKWTKSQASLLKDKDFTHLDIVNLIEEIESLGRTERRAIKSHLIILLQHLLKIKMQPKKHTSSWDKSVKNARQEIHFILEDSPSLKRELSRLLSDSYPFARDNAIAETGLDEKDFPKECPWKLSEIL